MLNRDKPDLAAAVLEPHGRPRRRENAGPGLRPLDEDDRVLEVRLEVSPFRWRDVAEAEEIEVRDLDSSLVAVADRKRRARDQPRHAERTAGAADEGRLPRAELAGDRDDVAGSQTLREPGRELFSFCRRAGLGQNKPS